MFPNGPAADPAGSHHERRIRSFQPRRSRVTANQADALNRLWPKWGLDIDGLAPLDLRALFAPPEPVDTPPGPQGPLPTLAATQAKPTSPTAPSPSPSAAPSLPVVLEIGFG
ncbi:hypothetical protein QMK28_17870, partial [Streptomyces sp. H27-D2]|nr:hypothetical protein [Streptomyces sp. H27-D2]